MLNNLSSHGLGTKFSIPVGFGVALFYIFFTLVLSNRASEQLQATAPENLHSRVSGINDMAQSFDSSLSEADSRYTQLFNSIIPQPIARDESQATRQRRNSARFDQQNVRKKTS